MSTVDDKVEGAAGKLQQLADKLAAEGGVKSKVAPMLADDADLLRKLKPSLIQARAKGEAPTDRKRGHGAVSPSAPQLGKRPKPKRGTGAGGPNPWLVVGAALVAGIVIAKVIDWRGHAHPSH